MKQLYRSYEQSTEIFNDFSKLYKKNFSIESIGQTWEKREINLITISSDIKNAHKKPALFFTGTIHAREWIGHELAIEFATYILKNLEFDLMLQEYLNKATIYMVPCANPDGFEYSRNHFSFWRKNRRVNADGTFGVDLNRNFPIGFIQSTKTTSNIYGGPHAFSEPETIALKEFVETHDNISIALDYHSQGNVFFPAHDFRHEDTIDTSDMNILCANMAEEIKKISGREYGIHQGKPPASLISGSGREFYYSKGIISSVVEVGTRNISDYMGDMNENLREHIPALLSALKEVPNYDKKSSLKRVDSFDVTRITSSTVSLKWNYEKNDDLFVEIYRSDKNKNFCLESNLIKRTNSLEFVDINLSSNKSYYYNIRVVNKKLKIKSAFYPQVVVRTTLDFDEFSRTYHANASETGYVAQNLKSNEKHFGNNSLFVGVDKTKGISYAIVTIDLKTISKDANIKSASFNLYPINRVSTTIEKYGEWNVGIVDNDSINDITCFEDVHNAKILSYIGQATQSYQLTQGIWRTWSLSGLECNILNTQLKNEKLILRIEGPQQLKIGRDKQMMQWDIGYGRFGFGLPYRPRLELTYEVEEKSVTIYAKDINTISKKMQIKKEASCGFDEKGNNIYSTFDFNLSSLPSYENTMITKAYFELNSTKAYLKDDIRFHLEFVDNNINKNYNSITKREVIQNIGYDVSANELKNNQTQYFVFDSFAQIKLNEKLKENKDISFVLSATSAKKSIKDKTISWEVQSSELAPKLVLEYIDKRRYAVDEVKNAKIINENGKIKLLWENPKDKDFRGVIVVKNAYRKPLSFADGQKIYAGNNEFTYDEFGAKDINKYYGIFTYDTVPNYSKAQYLKFSIKK